MACNDWIVSDQNVVGDAGMAIGVAGVALAWLVWHWRGWCGIGVAGVALAWLVWHWRGWCGIGVAGVALACMA